MIRPSLTAAAVALLLPGLIGCAATPAQRMQRNVETVGRERKPNTLVERGRAFARIGDMTRAEQYLTAALDEGANPYEVLPLLMQVCVKTGRFRVAIRHAEAHLDAHPDDNRARYLLGTLFLAVGNIAAARQELETVLESDPVHADAHYTLAVIARDSENDLVRADQHFRAYLRLRPDGPYAEKARASLLKSVP